jgi:hypothetical protein
MVVLLSALSGAPAITSAISAKSLRVILFLLSVGVITL